MWKERAIAQLICRYRNVFTPRNIHSRIIKRGQCRRHLIFMSFLLGQRYNVSTKSCLNHLFQNFKGREVSPEESYEFYTSAINVSHHACILGTIRLSCSTNGLAPAIRKSCNCVAWQFTSMVKFPIFGYSEHTLSVPLFSVALRYMGHFI